MVPFNLKVLAKLWPWLKSLAKFRCGSLAHAHGERFATARIYGETCTRYMNVSENIFRCFIEPDRRKNYSWKAPANESQWHKKILLLLFDLQSLL